MRRPLCVEDLLGGPSREERQHDLRELGALEVAPRVDGVEQPLLEPGDAVGGDRVPLPVRSFLSLDRVHDYEAVAKEP